MTRANIATGNRDMEEIQHRSSWGHRIWKTVKVAFWLIVAYIVLTQFYATKRLESARADLLDQFQQQRKSRVIAMIHRMDTVSLFGVEVSKSISIDDSEAVLRAIRLTPPDQPIDLILHTPGGLLLAAEQIAKALVDHKGKVTVFVPHYAMSGGTLMALAADQIVMDSNAVLGPVDPQIGDMPAASIVRAVEMKKPSNVSDEMLVLADISQKARLQTVAFLAQVLLKHLPKEKAIELATVLSDGRFTHDFPIMVETARQLGLPVSTNMPAKIYELMDLYPQSGSGRPSVYYVPLRHLSSEGTGRTSPAKQSTKP
ncbi:MAG: enoyl-CoA hydratase-related protein [Bryobacteraceae bacterium]